MASDFYNGGDLLSQRDLDGNVPEIFLCTTNRSGGKTTWFNKYLVNCFKKGKGKFCLIFRYRDDLPECADKFFKDIQGLFFPEDVMTDQAKSSGLYYELFLNNQSCGYAVALNVANRIKNLSHLLSDVERMFFDEFQCEQNTGYCKGELNKLQSLHRSIGRGHGKQRRYVPLYMAGNTVSLINPYYLEFGISTRLQDNTRFLRGHGWVLEAGFIQSAADASMESGFDRAFSNSSYGQFASQNVYLNDSNTFIGKPSGAGKYLATLRYKGRDYAIREYREEGFVYCDDRPDMTFPYRIVVTTEDHNINYLMLKRNDGFLGSLRFFFEKGCFRFKDLKCKEAAMSALAYRV